MPTQVETGNIKPRIQFTADGEQKEFQFFFTIYEPENVKVYIEDVLQIGGYSLSLNEEVPGGIVVFAEPPAAGKLITVYRDLELKRTTILRRAVRSAVPKSMRNSIISFPVWSSWKIQSGVPSLFLSMLPPI